MAAAVVYIVRVSIYVDNEVVAVVTAMRVCV